LPENITLQSAQNPGGVLPPAVETRAQSNDAMNSQTTYVPLNVHANPYGHPPQPTNGQMPTFPEPQQQQQQQQQRLPSRDIPMNSLEFQQDAEIQANYVPRQRMASDYVRDYEQQDRHRDRSKVALQTADDWYQRLQIPILVSLMFFIFQMPVFNTFLRKNFTFLTIYNDDGNFNIVGLVFKSILFGILFYSMQQFLVNFGSD
jgi:hypothetical protein